MSCSQEKNDSFLKLFERTEPVAASEVMPEVKQNLLAPTALYAQGKYLLFAESKLDTLLMLYDMENETLCRMLNRGQGPLEAIDVSSLGYGGTPETVYAHDNRGQNVFKISLSDSLSGVTLSKDTVGLSYLCASVAFDGDMGFFMQNAASKRFVRISSDSRLDFGDPIEIEGVDSKAVSKTLQGPCVLSPDQKRIVWFSSINDVFEVYEYSESEVNLITSRICYVPMVRNDGAITPKEHIGVRSLTANKDYIYALYIGKSFKELMQQGGNPGAAICSATILIFDWNGNPVRMIKTDREMFSIAYSAHDHCLYGLALDDEDNYSVYQIAV